MCKPQNIGLYIPLYIPKFSTNANIPTITPLFYAPPKIAKCNPKCNPKFSKNVTLNCNPKCNPNLFFNTFHCTPPPESVQK